MCIRDSRSRCPRRQNGCDQLLALVDGVLIRLHHIEALTLCGVALGALDVYKRQGVTDYIKDTAVGYLMEKEIKYLGNAVNDPVRPFTAILGGAKVADKLNVISNLLEKVDTPVSYTHLDVYKRQGCGG